MKTVIRNPIWWRRLTTFKICHILASVFACIALFNLVSCPPTDVCYSAECVRTASLVLGRMKFDVNPCTDFYEFTCGRFIDTTPIPEHENLVSTLSGIKDIMQKQLKDIITEERHEMDQKYLKLPNAYYRACINEDLIESLQGKPMQHILEELGGWPVTDCDCWKSEKWQDIIKKLRRKGFNSDYIFGASVILNKNDRTKQIIALHEPSIGFGYEGLVEGLNGPILSAYNEYMNDMAVFFGADKDTAKTELKKSLQFEKDLANIILAAENTQPITFNETLHSIKQLQALFTDINWLDYINSLFSGTLAVTEDEIISVLQPNFFKELEKLLNRTPNRVLADYLIWRAIDFSADSLSEKIRKRKSQFKAASSGEQQQEQPRCEQCLNIVLETFQMSVGSLYVRKYFNQTSKDNALELVSNVREAFEQILEQAQWMDNATKQEAKKKLSLITDHVGYTKEILDHNKLAYLFREMKPIDPDKFFEAVLRINFLKNYYLFRNLRLPVQKNDWTMYSNPIEINAFYSRTDNSIEVPAGILQDPFFNMQRPQYMNYGTAGYVIGHEITHGFDQNGHLYDGNGNYYDWWRPETKKHYLEKVGCLIEQYDNYTDKQTGLNVNGVNTLNENIADNGGIKQAYLAYQLWVTQNSEEPQLPGLNYTSQQMLWIAASQMWCSKAKTDRLIYDINNEHYSLDKFRVLGPFQNMPEFSSDFKCAPGTPMNPVKKCKIW